MACAIRLLQLLEDDPALAESLGEVPVAVIEKGRVAGAHQLSGGVMNPCAIRAAVPGRRLLAALRRGRQGDRLLHAQPQARDAAEADAAAVPQPRQLRRLGRRAQPLAGREGRGGRRLRAVGDRRREAAGRGRAPSSACARATRAATSRAARSRTSSRAPTSIAKATVLAEGCWGHLTGAALKGLGLAAHGPAGLGARRQGGLGGRAAARPRDPHARLAAAPAGASTRSSAARGSTR